MHTLFKSLLRKHTGKFGYNVWWSKMVTKARLFKFTSQMQKILFNNMNFFLSDYLDCN